MKTSGSLRQFAIPTKGILFVLFLGLQKKKERKKLEPPCNSVSDAAKINTLLALFLPALSFIYSANLSVFFSLFPFLACFFFHFIDFLFTLINESRDFFFNSSVNSTGKNDFFS